MTTRSYPVPSPAGLMPSFDVTQRKPNHKAHSRRLPPKPFRRNTWRHPRCCLLSQLSFSPAAGTPSVGRGLLSYQEKSVLFSWPFRIETSIWKGLSQANSSTAGYSLNLKQCKIDYFCSLCKLQMALVLTPWYLTSLPSVSAATVFE